MYLAMHLHGMEPGGLVWLRYSMFILLYPVGIGSEWWLMYRCIEPLRKVSAVGPLVFWFLLVLYIPGKSNKIGNIRGEADLIQARIRCSIT
jgi:very-long-chain (3R)-3-hydroxyacyl-CoA dehydratase